MLVIVVEAIVKIECAVEFMAATLANAKASLGEPGIARFDVLRDSSNPERFVLIEVYRNADAAADHKGTQHYAKWRDSVAPMMQKPRSSIRYENVFPTEAGWESAKV
jgi:(4S)-4-hydroxy-5-phosphonooxypentane-2,3-dione isomerase